jgi:hypothetical protein
VGLTPEYVLIFGAHRLAAHEKLERATIPAIIHDFDALHVALAEIDENIERHALTRLEESLALTRRKEIYLAMHPETESVTKRGGPGRGKKTNDKLAGVSFAQDTANKTGKSRRTIERKVEIGEKLDREAAEMLKGTRAESKLSELRALAAMPADAQRATAAKLQAGKIACVQDQSATSKEPSKAEEGLAALKIVIAATKACGIFDKHKQSLQELERDLQGHADKEVATARAQESADKAEACPASRLAAGDRPALPDKPTMDRPAKVSIRGKAYDVAMKNAMWFFRQTAEAGWTNCSEEFAKTIEQELGLFDGTACEAVANSETAAPRRVAGSGACKRSPAGSTEMSPRHGSVCAKGMETEAIQGAA